VHPVIDVLVDGRPVRGRTQGVGRVVTTLVNLMKTDGRFRFRVLCNCADHWPDPSRLTFEEAGRAGNGSTPSRRFVFEQYHLRRILGRVRPDVYWATWNYGVPWSPPCTSVLTVHDLIPLRFRTWPWTWRNRLSYSLSLRLAFRGARSIVSDSAATREELALRCNVSRDRVVVIRPGVSAEFGPHARPGDPDFNIPKPFALYVGGRERRKNLEALLRAFEHGLQNGLFPDLTLALTGLDTNLDPDSRAVYERLKQRAPVRFIGHISEDALPALYRQAAMFVFPSVAEGFGFPPLEAMACGVPVVCGSADSLPEVVGEAAHVVNVRDPTAIASAMHKIVSDHVYAANLRTAGLAQAAKFRWDESAEQMATVLLAAAGGRRRRQ
jgi:glycosyltransferase involved in cell wall biosynthesis